MSFEGKVAVITGGAQGIGKCICEEFEKQGARVCVIDKRDNPYFVGDLADKATLERFTEQVVADFGQVDYLINNAAPLMKGITECSYEEFEYAQRVGVTAAFYLSKLKYKQQGALRRHSTFRWEKSIPTEKQKLTPPRLLKAGTSFV